MLWMLVAVLALLWVIGMLTALTLGGLLHLLLAAAVALAGYRLWRRRSLDRPDGAGAL